MTDNRANLKIDPDDLERFNELRGGTKQKAFFRELLDHYENDDNGGSDVTVDDVRSVVKDENEKLLRELRGQR